MSEPSDIPSLCLCTHARTHRADKAKPRRLMETERNVNTTLVHSARQASFLENNHSAHFDSSSLSLCKSAGLGDK